MVFLQEDWEPAERSPEYDRVLKSLIKYQIRTLCQKLADVGEESCVLTASVTKGTFSHVGSAVGEGFLNNSTDFKWKFLSFCSRNASDVWEATPTAVPDVQDILGSALSTDIQNREQTFAARRHAKGSQKMASFYHPHSEVPICDRFDMKNDENIEESMVLDVNVQVKTEPDLDSPACSDFTSIRSEEERQRTKAGGKASAALHDKKQAYIKASIYKGSSLSHTRSSSVKMNEVIYSLNNERGGGADAFEKGMALNSHVMHQNNSRRKPSHSSSRKGFKTLYSHDESDLTSDIEFDIVNEIDQLKNSAGGKIIVTPDSNVGNTERNRIDSECVNTSLVLDQAGNSESEETMVNSTLSNSSHHQPDNGHYEKYFCQSYMTEYKEASENDSQSNAEDNPNIQFDNLQYPCSVCHKMFRQSSALEEHMMVHTGEGFFRCTVCQQSFLEPHQLSLHVRCHGAPCEKPFTCGACRKTFSKLGNMKMHIVLHTGERPYKCHLCGKSFTQSHNLTYHLRSHTGERPYQCTLCEKSFCLSNNLKLHMRQHTGERPYQCQICPKTFAHSNSFKSHMRTHMEQLSN